jgi:hypothetical protein
VNRRLVLWLSFGVLIVTVAPTSAYAESATRRVPVRAAGISLSIPRPWVVVDPPKNPPDMKRYFQRFPKVAEMVGIDPTASAQGIKDFWLKRLKVRKLWAIDVNGDGDNVLVSFERGAWYSGLDEWREAAKLSASTTHSEILASDETRIGSQQAFTEIERYEDPPGHQVIYAYMEIRGDHHNVIEIATTVDGDELQDAQAIQQSVRALR